MACERGSAFHFKLLATCPNTRARAGIMSTPHGDVLTPAFSPVGSQATVKALSPQDIKEIGANVVLCNTYHLYLRPGVDVIEEMGGLHRFMAWGGPVITDSGGYQVFSLGHLRKLTEDGVLFRSHLDGREHLLTPELSIEAQDRLGADIIMALDECTPYGEDIGVFRQATERTHRWAERCLRAHRSRKQALFGIVQGGTFPELRKESAHYVTSLGFQGYAVGGLAVGEPKAIMYEVLEGVEAYLPKESPRHLMGVGSPEDIFECVDLGMDIFDCALPTRAARNGALFTRLGRVNIKNAAFQRADRPLDDKCDCYTCKTFSTSYLHHLFKSRELLFYRVATLHNLRFILSLMEKMREAILGGTFYELKRDFLQNYRPTDEEVRMEQKKKWLKRQRPPWSEEAE
ncbi:MAG: tRNA guanosine(34) transglycosylase Tgt [Chloroflexi bacterium]|nr:tRNA guanosine(34) transglycosylase Tgt [Chloroflexota bacterium]